MNSKSYLSKQIKLLSLTSYDMFTDEEYEIYSKILNIINQINGFEKKDDPTVFEALVSEKKELIQKLADVIALHDGTPRMVRIRNVVDTKQFRDAYGNYNFPQHVSWRTIRPSKKVTEFLSEESRAMGLSDQSITFDKIIVSWKSLDVLRQLIVDGFCMTFEDTDGTIKTKHYRFMTASAGQLRTDKTQFISDDAWAEIEPRIMCGLTYDIINAKGGINTSKLMAYTALPCSATDTWEDFDIDRAIVVEDFEAPVTGTMKYIKRDYTADVGEHTVTINHIDGSGMMLPSVNGGRYTNFMVRLPWVKGLLSTFDFIEFCRVNHCEPVLTDIYGVRHDLVKENIQIIFSKSQFKLYKYYDSWEQYKECFKRCGCHANRTNYEEDWIPDTDMNYQFLQTLVDMTDDEIRRFASKAHEDLVNLCRTKESMLETLGANLSSRNWYNQALAIYDELLRDGYSRQTLKSIKKKRILDARSGAIRCKNKRLFALPDFYAACEYLFMGIKEPKGLLKGDEVASVLHRKNNVLVDRQLLIDANMNPGRYESEYVPVVAVLRSPHLAMEWFVAPVVNDQSVYYWFRTKGIYTSCHSLITRRLQLDVDGDQLNVICESVLVDVALRNMKEFDVQTLFYDAGKASPEIVTQESLYAGVKRAHDNSNIGQVSNNLTKLWSKDDPDRHAADLLCCYNNAVIDGAKTGWVNSYELYPEANKRISKAVGGKKSKMPDFFQYTKNGRRNETSTRTKSFAKPTKSTMNRLSALFSDIKKINFSAAMIKPFNWQMLLANNDDEYNFEAAELFCEINDANFSNLISEGTDDPHDISHSSVEFVKDLIVDILVSRFGSLENVYSSVVKRLFVGDGLEKISGKQMFWMVFGHIACRNLQYNVQHSHICPQCGARIPDWSQQHSCIEKAVGITTCKDCGKIIRRTGPRVIRCNECKKKHRTAYVLNYYYETKGKD